jgi:hypothetical protein
MYHIVCEKIDPLSLKPEDLEAVGLDAEDLRKKPYHQRATELHTLVEWQPESQVWVIEQEINGHALSHRRSEDRVSPFFSTTYQLAPGQNYGRGFVDNCLGDLRSYNEISGRVPSFAHVASMMLMFVDQASQLRNDDLLKPEGGIVRGARVTGGQCQDVALMQSGKGADFGIVATGDFKGEMAFSSIKVGGIDIDGDVLAGSKIRV